MLTPKALGIVHVAMPYSLLCCSWTKRLDQRDVALLGHFQIYWKRLLVHQGKDAEPTKSDHAQHGLARLPSIVDPDPESYT